MNNKNKKYCPSCKTYKDLHVFRNTRKTEDGKYPICKRCDTILAKVDYKCREFVRDRLWLQIRNSVIPNQEVGKDKMFFNKGLFTRWLYSNPDFKAMYGTYLRDTIKGTLELSIEAINTSDILSLSNLRVRLKEGTALQFEITE
jgi:hypothetical protein